MGISDKAKKMIKKKLTEIDEKNNHCYRKAQEFRRRGDIVMARGYLLKSAIEDKHPIAMFHLAYAYYSGEDWYLAKDPQKAAELFLASGTDSGRALYVHCLRYGIGVERNEDLIKKYTDLLEETRDNFARGFCLLNGYIGPRTTTFDETKSRLLTAIGYLQISSMIDDNEFAQKLLGEHYANGIFGTKSLELAKFHFGRAEKQGSEYAYRCLMEIKI